MQQMKRKAVIKRQKNRIECPRWIALVFLSSLLSLWSCQSSSVQTRSLKLEFGTCLGDLNTTSSCTSQIFRPLQRGPIGCWIIESSTSEFRASMTWDGDRLNLTDRLDLTDFNFDDGDFVEMYLFLFDSLETASLCNDIIPSVECSQIPGCVAQLRRSNTPLSFSESISFRDDFGQCFVDTPKINAVELCDDGVDGDCDGIMDEGCVRPGECQPEDVRLCENACGRSEQRCVNGSYTSCRMPMDEVCSDRTGDPQDEDCDGVIDEGCAVCNDGESRPCSNRCGDGIELCIDGAFQSCDAPLPNDEICGDSQDNDCDQNVDEGCADCNDGEVRMCFSDCGSGTEVCENEMFTGCTAPQPEIEQCADGIDNDCDQNIDEDCPSCIPRDEVCDGIDNDCDNNVDEGTRANQPCLATRDGCAGQVPGFIICDLSGAQRCFPNESLFMLGREVCDGIDNNCDGLIDNIVEVGNSCRGEDSPTCAYSRLVCLPSDLGVVQDLLCEAEPTPVEVCDGTDNDCNGIIDDLDLGNTPCTASCDRAGTQKCVNGNIICETDQSLPEEICDDNIDNNCNGQIDENCPVCAANETTCDGIDDDCNGQIDEGVCGRLIYDHCEARLAWWFEGNSGYSGPNPPWAQWPPTNDSSQACPSLDELDTDNYSCDVARRGSDFQTIVIEYHPVGPQHWLGIGWSCESSSDLSAEEQVIVTWANTHCHIALGYKDYYGSEQLVALNPQTCPQSSPYPGYRAARCIQTQSNGSYSAIELEGQVNRDDFFGLAFYCDRTSPQVNIDGAVLTQNIQNEFWVLFGSDQRGSPYSDGVSEWGQLPLQEIDNANRVRGVGTPANGLWNIFDLDRYLNDEHRLGMSTRVR